MYPSLYGRLPVDLATYADRVGLKLGATALDIIPLVEELRPFRSCEDLGWDDWEDQLTMVSGVAP